VGSKLNMKLFLIASLAVFVVLSILEYFVHQVFLSSMYAGLVAHAWWRDPEGMKQFLIWFYVGYACFALLFSYIYTRGYEGKPGEGFRYGVIIGLLMSVPAMFIQHAFYPYPGGLLLSWCIATFIESVLCGILVGMIYKVEKT
jgi:hypothetical protein